MEIIKQLICVVACFVCLHLTTNAQRILDTYKNDEEALSGTTNQEQNGDSRRFLEDSGVSWSEWSVEKGCSKTCGGRGFLERTRTCSSGVRNDCEVLGGRWWDVIICDNGPCAASWMEWGTALPCSTSCGIGVVARLRNCSTFSNTDCVGKNYEIKGCSLGDCPVTTEEPTTVEPTTHIVGTWSNWNTVISCSHTCGPGFGEKLRKCSTGRTDDCIGKGWEVISCNLGACIVDGDWSNWGAWAGCSATCGSGSKQRLRTCVFPDPTNPGKDCDGVNYETQPCSTAACPVDGVWAEWGGYAACSATCDEGLKLRKRNCTFASGAPHGAFCSGLSFDTTTCTDVICSVDGVWSTWSGWTTCTATCNGGIMFRARSCSFPSDKPKGAKCPGSSVDSKICATDKCAVDGVFTDWSPWTQCTHSCDSGLQSRVRVCVFVPGAPHGADCAGNKSQTQDCGTQRCPVDGIWGAWAIWASCSKTCGGGVTSRQRTCDYVTPGAPHGKPCLGEGYMRKNCNNVVCTVDAKWSLWTRFSQCSKTCGGGQRIRTRTCVVDPVAPMGRNCTGISELSEDCNTVACPVDGTLTAWADWSVCSASCDGGDHYRTRQCFFPLLLPHGNDCVGNLREDTSCNDLPCPTTTQATTTTTEATADGHWAGWESWSTCTATCGTGNQLRERICTYPDHTLHGIYCPGPKNQTRDCNTDYCPVDGSWTNWSTYSRCSVSCENGTHSRNRTCLFDPRYPMGSNCSGVDYESGTCYTGSKCPVDGLWSGWEAWTTCSATCGGGLQGRVRICEFQKDTPHGAQCPGDSHQNQTCGTNLCPVDGVFGEWSNWTNCTLTCGNGTKTRNRTCDFPDGVPHGLDCIGDLDVTHPCNEQLCPVDGVWSEWGTWDDCSMTCGGGAQSRRRTCHYHKDAPHGEKCNGTSEEKKTCNTDLCPVDGHWSGWETWSRCSVSCENGTRIRSHTCTFPDGLPHGNDCVGPANETDVCNDGACPVDGVWSVWATWSACSVTCANGTSSRDRTCDFPDGVPHGNICSGSANETVECHTQLCPVDGVFNAWSNWTGCSATCGGGQQLRDRTCEFDALAPHGKDCVGNYNDTQICNNNNCPVDGIWSVWSNYTQCTVTCGNGTQFRTRRCDYQAGYPHGTNCSGNSVETLECGTDVCPVDGHFTIWSDWSKCSKTCANGTQSRNRRCEYSATAPHGDPCVGDFKEARECNTENCPIDGHWSEWSKYGTCSKTCGKGDHVRNRSCIYHDPAPHGAQCFGNLTDVGECGTKECPVDGSWSVWNNWTDCTATCGKGTQVRGRICEFVSGFPKGVDCSGESSEARECSPEPCPVDGTLTDWSGWTSCSYTCGDGIQYRTRKCQFPDSGIPRGDNCTGSLSDRQNCKLAECPVNGQWSTWGSWHSCSSTCGGGTRHRMRDCRFPPHVIQGDFCPGLGADSEVCNNDTCSVDGSWGQWSDFSSCTKSCGNGTSTRTRTCEFSPADAPHGTDCPGEATDVIPCNTTECAQDGVWSSWSDWNTCSKDCAGGNQTRDRTCTWPSSVHGNYCIGDPSELQTCNTDLCPVDGHWSDWSTWAACSATCNVGIRAKTRTCLYDDKAPHGVVCVGHNIAQAFCNDGMCALDGIWAAWTAYGACSATCGNGTKERTRKCAFPVPGAPHGRNCTGGSVETLTCMLNECAVDGTWGDWTAWSSCTTSCGVSDKVRTRVCEFDDTKPKGSDCVGVAKQTDHCHVGSCPVDGVWHSWHAWSSCSATCAGGTRRRRRECYFPPRVPSGDFCLGKGIEQETCNNSTCPVDGTFGDWGEWSACSVTCGGGTQGRNRTCDYIPAGAPHGSGCVGNTSDSKTCNADICPVDGVFGDWGGWSTCTATCDGGTQHRNRTCQFLPPGTPHGKDCAGNTQESNRCNSDACPTSTMPLTTTASTMPPTTTASTMHPTTTVSTMPPTTTASTMPSTTTASTMPSTTIASTMHSTTTASPMPSTATASTMPPTTTASTMPPTTTASTMPPTTTASTMPSTTTASTMPPTTTASTMPSTTTASTMPPTTTASTMHSTTTASPMPSTATASTMPPTTTASTMPPTTTASTMPPTTTASTMPSTTTASTMPPTTTASTMPSTTTASTMPPTTTASTMHSTTTASTMPPTTTSSTIPPTTTASTMSPTTTASTMPPTTTASTMPPTTTASTVSQTTKALTMPPTTTASTVPPPSKASTMPPSTGTTKTLSTLPTTPPPTTVSEPRTCMQCTGPVRVCEQVKASLPCDAHKSYCINEITNHEKGDRIVNRRCGTYDECYNGWFSKYSADDKCINFAQSTIYTNNFYCEFCCTSDNCNDMLNPVDKFLPH